MGKRLNFKENKILIFIVVLILIVLLGGIVHFGKPLLSFFTNPDQARKLIVEAGVMGPLIYILMQIAQVIIAPIPGQVIGLIGGLLFGPIWGVIYTVIGSTIGFTIIFILTRKLGRPFVERIVSKKLLDRFDHLSEENGVLVFFLIFLLPAFPDDVISFIAGLTTIKISTLVTISVLGRLPGYIVLSITGNGLVENLKISVFISVMLIIFSVIAWWKRVWIHDFVNSSNHILFLKEEWKISWKMLLVWGFGILIGTIFLYKFIEVIV